jgi:site-specific DNA recombinase
VQEVLRGHALSGDRSHKHEQYLKGSIFCGKCGGRLVFSPVTGNGGRYEYFKCFGRHNRRNGCDAPHLRADKVEEAVERHYGQYEWLSDREKAAVRAAVRRYADVKLKAATREAERAGRRLEALKQEQQRLLQLSYRDLVDEDVLAAEQARIRKERAEVAKWAQTASHDADDISAALDEALQLLDDPGTAYVLATPVTRRMFNQALFEQLLILHDEVIDAVPTPWVRALEAVARRTEGSRRRAGGAVKTRPRAFSGRRVEARNDHGPRIGGHGLNDVRMVRMRGLEPPLPFGNTDLNRARLPIPPHPRALRGYSARPGGPALDGGAQDWEARGAGTRPWTPASEEET